MEVAYPLPTITITAGASGKINLRDLPLKLLEGVPHVTKFLVEVAATPTTTALPTTFGVNNAFTRFDFWDGRINRFTGGLNHVRAWEQISNGGKVRFADADTDTASGTARYFRRVLHVGPPNFEGFPGDFAIPCAMLATGEIRWTQGALTDWAADCTVIAGTIKVTAILDVRHEVNLPPAYVRETVDLNAKQTSLPGECLIESMFLLNSASFDAITAGDFADLTVSAGGDDIVRAVDAPTVSSWYIDEFAVGEIGYTMGEPEAASDDNHKVVNRGTPTATVGGAQYLQPVVFSPDRAMITKLPRAESNTRLKWNGSQSSGVLLFGRILPQPESVITTLGAQVLERLELRQSAMKLKGLSGKDVHTPYAQFMPVTIKIG